MIPYSRQFINKDDLQAVGDTLLSPLITQGPRVGEFESALRTIHDCADAVACSSGSSALHLAYAACGIDEHGIGIVPSITFASTANAFRHLGAKVLFCDVDSATGLIDLNSLEQNLKLANISRKSGAGVIAPVSFAGKVAPLKECRRLADKYDFLLVEDASHSPLAWEEQEGEIVRSCSCEWTEYATLSFHPVKHVCCGEGGAVLCGTSGEGEVPRRMATHGIQRPNGPDSAQPWRYEQVDLGWNFRLTDLQASLGISQLSRLKDGVDQRRKLASIYNQKLSTSPFIDMIDLPALEKGHSWHLYIIRFKKAEFRDQAYHFLRNEGISTQVHYIPVYQHPYYRKLYGQISLDGAEKFFSGCLSIPLFPGMTSCEQEKVIAKLALFLKQAG